jgi:hypothetical protein
VLNDYAAARAVERAAFDTMTREQLVTFAEGALAACRNVDEQVTELRRELVAKDEAIAARDRDLRVWARAFAPNRPLGVILP